MIISSRVLEYTTPDRLLATLHIIHKGCYETIYARGNEEYIQFNFYDFDKNLISSKRFNMPYRKAVKYARMIPHKAEKELRRTVVTNEYVRYFYDDAFRLTKTITEVNTPADKHTTETQYEYSKRRVISRIVETTSRQTTYGGEKKTIIITEYHDNIDSYDEISYVLDQVHNEKGYLINETRRYIGSRSIDEIKTKYGSVRKIDKQLLSDSDSYSYIEYKISAECVEDNSIINIDSEKETITKVSTGRIAVGDGIRPASCEQREIYSVSSDEINELMMGE